VFQNGSFVLVLQDAAEGLLAGCIHGCRLRLCLLNRGCIEPQKYLLLTYTIHAL